MISAPTAADWRLHPQLEQDTVAIGDLPLSRVLLINDASYPWLLLVPRAAGAGEITDLPYIEQAQLMTEITAASQALKDITRCDKINVAALGNIVPQLHVHVIARSRGDAAWPKPVWGVVPPIPYGTRALETVLVPLRERLALR